MKIIFRTNFGKDIGFGHLYRSLSLAYATNKITHAEILFILNEKTELLRDFSVILSEKFDDDLNIIDDYNPDVIVFDSYLASKDYLLQLRDKAMLVMFDDNNNIYGEIPSHILINGNIYAKTLKYRSLFGDTKFLLGPKYLVMKPEYWSDIPDRDTEGEGILITTGGADFHRLMPEFMKALKDLDVRKRVIIGPAFEKEEIKQIEDLKDNGYDLIYKPFSLKKYIQISKIVITAAGSTIYEVLTLHRFPVMYVLADNQKKIAQALERYGIVNLGWYGRINWKGLEGLIKNLLHSQSIDKTVYTLFDGKGALRVAEEILKV